MRTPIKVSFRNEWNRKILDSPTDDLMDLVTCVTCPDGRVRREFPTCVVTYDYVALGRRVGIISRTFFRPGHFEAIISPFRTLVPFRGSRE